MAEYKQRFSKISYLGVGSVVSKNIHMVAKAEIDEMVDFFEDYEESGIPINWQFKTEDARIKLLRLYSKL